MGNKKQGKNKNIPLSKKQRKRMEKRGIAVKERESRPKMPKEKKLFIALICVISVMAILCATFGTILLVGKVSTVPYGSVYDTLTMSNYFAVKRMGKSFYTGNTFDFSTLETKYAPKDLAYMDEYIEEVRLANREEIALGQKTAKIGFADDIAIYITDIFRGGTPADEAAEDASRIPTSTMPLGTYISSISFTVGTEYFGKDFDDKLIAMNIAPVDTGREVRYNGTVTTDDTICLSYVVYKSASKKTEGITDETPVLDRYTWNKTAESSAGLSAARIDLSEDLEATLASAIAENCLAMGETFTFVLENYSLSGDGSNKATYKIEAQVHFAVEKEVTKDITFTFPTDFFTEGDGAVLMALNGKEVTFRVIIGGVDDYELPTFDRKFITETLGYEITATDEAGALAEYKEKALAEINASLSEQKHSDQIKTAFLHLANKVQTSSLYVTSTYPSSLTTSVKTSLLRDLQNMYISTYGTAPTESQLNSFAASYYYQLSGGQTISTYSEYLEYVASSQISQELIMYYVFRDSGMKITEEMLDAEYRTYMDGLIEDAGDPEEYDEDYFVDYYGGKDAIYQSLRRSLVYEMVGEYLLEQNNAKLS